MFGPSSRYFHLETLTYEDPSGKRMAYKERRFLPEADDMRALTEATVESNDRLDLIAARTLDRPEMFWQVADGNNAMDPFELTEQTGRALKVPVPMPPRSPR